MKDSMINDGLWDVFNNYHMGVTAENVAKQYGITREEQDKFAAASQQKAEAAQKAGKFADEIIPVEIPQRKGDPVVFDKVNSRAPALPQRASRNSSRPLTRKAASPRETLRASMTAPPSSSS